MRTNNLFSIKRKTGHVLLKVLLPTVTCNDTFNMDYDYNDNDSSVPLVVSTSQSFPHWWPITGFLTRITRRVPLVVQELPTLPQHLVFRGVSVARSLVLYVCFVDRCLSFTTFSFGHCVVCSSSIYGFGLPLWDLQTLLTRYFVN